MTDILLHIGLIKAASSYLQRWFYLNPQLLYQYDRICGFKSVNALMDYATEEKAPYRYYVISEERLSGGLPIVDYHRLMMRHKGYHKRPPPIRENNARICKLLHQIFPGARVLIVTRGFEGALRSVYSQYVRFGDCLSFKNFLLRYQLYIEQWLDYDHLIDLYISTFGRSNVILMPFEMLLRSEDEFLGTLEQELGLEPRRYQFGKVYPSFNPNELYWYSKISAYVLHPIARILTERWAIKLFNLYFMLFSYKNRLEVPIRIISRISDRKARMDIPENYLDRFRGKATLLREYPRYAPYTAEYFLDPVTETTPAPCATIK